MIPVMSNLIWLSLLFGGLAFAAPNHFTIVIGSALVCNDRVSADYFNGYMKRFFGEPAFNTGGANWWKVNESLFNSSSEYVFVGVGHDFIGATFKDSPDKLIANVKGAMGVEYRRMGAESWVAPTSGVLIKYYDKKTPSKMFCISSPSSIRY